MTRMCQKILRRTGAWAMALTIFVSASAVEAGNTITLFAAASLAPILENSTTPFSHDTGITVRISAAASSVLARQVASGAPADIVVLANPDWMQWLQDRGLINRPSRRDLISNRLALLRHTETELPAGLVPALESALKTGRLAMADPDHVPAGIYGKAALTSLGLWQQAAPALARSPNAPAAVALLSRGEVSAAISYSTDAHLSNKIVVHELFPQKLHPSIRYQIAAVSSSKNPNASQLIKFLLHPDRIPVFKAAGFAAPIAP